MQASLSPEHAALKRARFNPLVLVRSLRHRPVATGGIALDPHLSAMAS
jgi:hypothetical protein